MMISSAVIFSLRKHYQIYSPNTISTAVSPNRSISINLMSNKILLYHCNQIADVTFVEK